MYNFLHRTFLLFLWLACSGELLAQAHVVSGTVNYQKGIGMPGVNIQGRVAGVNLPRAATGPARSSRVS